MNCDVRQNSPHRLLVEGRDDKLAIKHLTAKCGWNWASPESWYPWIQEGEGWTGVQEALGPALKTYSRVGVVVDADMDLESKWKSIRGRLLGAGVDVPEELDPNGCLIDHGARRVGIWVMPDNRKLGKLEDFLSMLVPAGDPTWGYAGEACLQARHMGAPFGDIDFAKAHIHTWLAWRESPGRPLGTAIASGVFECNKVLAVSFVSWLIRLYRDR